MNPKFRAPVTRFSLSSGKVDDAIDAILRLPARSDGAKTACVRLDLYVSTSSHLTLVKSSTSLFVQLEDGSIDGRESKEMDSEMKVAFADVLIALNDDCDLTEIMGAYPLPWQDRTFSDHVNNRYLSILFLGQGIGCVLQEYLPSWIDDDSLEAYVSEDATAQYRSELMSVFLPEDESSHTRLAMEAKLSNLHPVLSGMFAHHCDHDIEIDLDTIDPLDTL